MIDKKATWKNGKKKVKGSWYYNWAGDFFVITLDSRDPITGQPRQFLVYGESPEWGNWKRVAK